MSYHSFDPQVAKQYGVTEAVIIQHFQFWIRHNKSNNRNQYEGRTWTYNSAKAMAEIFPYLTAKMIYGAICRLQDHGVLIKSNFNDHKYDRTSWYAFNDEGFWIDRQEKVDFPVGENGTRQKGEPIPDTLTVDNTVKDPPGSPAPARGEQVGMKKKAKQPEGKKEKRPAREFWQPFVDTWHDFYVAKFNGESPSIVGKALTDLGKLYDLLQLRCKKKLAVWTEKWMVEGLKYFLDLAHSEEWLRKHFLLSNLCEQFDAVYARAAETKGKGEPKMTPNAEIEYIIGRYQEGQLDERLLTPNFYRLLEDKKIVPLGYRENFQGKDPDEQKKNACLEWLKNLNQKATS